MQLNPSPSAPRNGPPRGASGQATESGTPVPDAADTERHELLHLVDFKWLMAGEGHRIDLQRLKTDRAYARGCIALAQGSTCRALRDAGERMGQLLIHSR